MPPSTLNSLCCLNLFPNLRKEVMEFHAPGVQNPADLPPYVLILVWKVKPCTMGVGLSRLCQSVGPLVPWPTYVGAWCLSLAACWCVWRGGEREVGLSGMCRALVGLLFMLGLWIHCQAIITGLLDLGCFASSSTA